MNEENKKFVLKNLIVFGVLFFIVFSVIILNIPIGFTVFENIEKTPLFIVICVKLIVVIIIIVVIVLIFAKKIKNNKKESDKNG